MERFQKKSGRFTSRKRHRQHEKLARITRNRWERYRNSVIEEMIETVHLDHSYHVRGCEDPQHTSETTQLSYTSTPNHERSLSENLSHLDVRDVALDIIVGQHDGRGMSDSDEENDMSWQVGRRIVELVILSKELSACKKMLNAAQFAKLRPREEIWPGLNFVCAMVGHILKYIFHNYMGQWFLLCLMNSPLKCHFIDATLKHISHV